MKRVVAAFDFDGTLTCSDTLVPFMRHALGDVRFCRVVSRNALWLSLYLLGLYPNWKAKQRLFASCFAGWKQADFEEAGRRFASVRPVRFRPGALEALRRHLLEGNRVYIISASMQAWVRPLLRDYSDLLTFLTTEPEVRAGRLTGRFLSANCYGAEKVRRLLSAEPRREDYILYAYGDSRGDKELLAFADHPFYRSF